MNWKLTYNKVNFNVKISRSKLITHKNEQIKCTKKSKDDVGSRDSSGGLTLPL